MSEFSALNSDEYHYPHAPNFIVGPSAPAPLITIGVLGPETTSTYLSAENLTDRLKTNGAASRIIGYESFEALHRELGGEGVDLGVVPAAMKGANDYFFDPVLELLFVTESYLPTYGLVTNANADSGAGKLLVTKEEPVPAISQLLDGRADPKNMEIRLVGSTSEAASLVATGKARFGITNSASAAKFGLSFVAECPAIRMAWLIFGRRRRPIDLRWLLREPPERPWWI
jgi:prephenate decarboxylase